MTLCAFASFGGFVTNCETYAHPAEGSCRKKRTQKREQRGRACVFFHLFLHTVPREHCSAKCFARCALRMQSQTMKHTCDSSTRALAVSSLTLTLLLLS